VSGGDGDDLILGGAAQDVLLGDGGDDRLNGGLDNDTVNGGPGSDLLHGGFAFVLAGAFYDGGDGDDLLVGGGGVDVADYSNRTASLTIRLTHGTSGADGERDTLRAVLNAFGGTMPDRIVGTRAANYLSGGGGDDTLFGLGGNDALTGGDGSDHVYGNQGFDFLLLVDGIVDSYQGGPLTKVRTSVPMPIPSDFIDVDVPPRDVQVPDSRP
jgi:Ca2+-binding RTX toxin-like protein